MFLRQNLRTTNDTNGNPRRLWVVYELVKETGGERQYAETALIVNEGYRGRQCLPTVFQDAPDLPSIDITPTEYRTWLRVKKTMEEI